MGIQCNKMKGENFFRSHSLRKGIDIAFPGISHRGVAFAEMAALITFSIVLFFL